VFPEKGEPILILGTGALATFFAARLSASGAVVTMFGTWEDGLLALRSRGAELDGKRYPVKTASQIQECRGSKKGFVLVKSWQTERVARQLTQCLDNDGLTLTLQNGYGNAEILAGILGSERVIQGITTMGAFLTGPGRAVSGGEGPIILQDEPRTGSFVRLLKQAGFQVHVVDDIRPTAWAKLAVNAAINPLSALLDIRNGELLELPSACLLMDALAGEAAGVAHAMGFQMTEEAAIVLARQVAGQTAQNISSMLQDVRRGSMTEVDAINGAIVREGEKRRIPTPINRAILQLVNNIGNFQ
jgi:2-dehydropantoate 2-reductase